jgi:peptidoglycan hydrolase-like protein with peptidoglycan-binding domain
LKRIVGFLIAVLLLCSAWPAMSETVPPSDTPVLTTTPASAYTPDELLQQWYQIGAMLRENGLYPYVELRKGDTGYEVKALQMRLSDLGYYKKEVADNFGKGTYSAMRLFEKANKLTVDGVASVSDQQTLFSNKALAYSEEKTTSNNNGSDAVSGATSKKD